MEHKKLDLAPIVKRAKAGKTAAFDELISLTQNRLFRFCLVLCGNRALSEDLCQETYLKAFRNLEGLSSGDAFLGWIFQIAKNLYIDYLRSKGNQTEQLEAESIDLNQSTKSEVVEIMAVRETLARLEPEDRMLVLLVDLEERTYEEAAEVLGVSEDTVRSRLFRARKKFLEFWRAPDSK